MTDNEVIQAKTQEINRLHRVCRSKDDVIRLNLEFMIELKNDLHNEGVSFTNYVNDLEDWINKSKEALG